MRPGGNGGWELGGIVINAGARGQQAIHNGGAGRGTEWAGGIAIFKHHTFAGEAAQVWRVYLLVAIRFEKLSRQLISHNKEDVGFRAACHYILTYENAAAGFDPHISAYTIVIVGARLSLFADLFRICDIGHSTTWSAVRRQAGDHSLKPLPPLGWGRV